jgi:hypothetical protein
VVNLTCLFGGTVTKLIHITPKTIKQLAFLIYSISEKKKNIAPISGATISGGISLFIFTISRVATISNVAGHLAGRQMPGTVCACRQAALNCVTFAGFEEKLQFLIHPLQS